MKKSIIALSAMLFLAVGVSNAQTERTAKEAQQTQVVDQEKKVEIKQEALPDAVLEILKSDRFNTWDVSRVYETAKGDKKIYEVVLMNGEKKATYKFDEDGKTIG